MQVPLSNRGHSVLQSVKGDRLRNARRAQRVGNLLPYYYDAWWRERLLRIQ